VEPTKPPTERLRELLSPGVKTAGSWSWPLTSI